MRISDWSSDVCSSDLTFHSSRMRMKKVTKEELAAMDADSYRCALELSDAAVHVLGYACLVAIMSLGEGYHRVSEARLHKRTVETGHAAPVLHRAGARVQRLKTLQAPHHPSIAPLIKNLERTSSGDDRF